MKQTISIGLLMAVFALSPLGAVRAASCISTSPSTITVLSPNGGESFYVGDTMRIRWSTCNIDPSAPVFIHLDGMHAGGELIANSSSVTAGSGGYMFVIPSSFASLSASNSNTPILGTNYFRVRLDTSHGTIAVTDTGDMDSTLAPRPASASSTINANAGVTGSLTPVEGSYQGSTPYNGSNQPTSSGDAYNGSGGYTGSPSSMTSAPGYNGSGAYVGTGNQASGGTAYQGSGAYSGSASDPLHATAYQGDGSAAVLFPHDLEFGMRGDEVKRLQLVLIGQGLLAADNATGYFGNFTFAAVKTYQSKTSLPVVGRVGPLTRAKLNAGVTVQ